jgi:hypothetical protein
MVITEADLPEHIDVLYNECVICCQGIKKELFLPFCCQPHRLCKSCIVSMVQLALNNFQIVKCPHEGCAAEFD